MKVISYLLFLWQEVIPHPALLATDIVHRTHGVMHKAVEVHRLVLDNHIALKLVADMQMGVLHGNNTETKAVLLNPM